MNARKSRTAAPPARPQRRHRTGRRAAGVGHYDLVIAGLVGLGIGENQRGGSPAGQVGAAELPLIGERTRAGGGDKEAGRLAVDDRLALRLRNDGRRGNRLVVVSGGGEIRRGGEVRGL